jgi:uncharacterized membrane protein
MSSDRVLALAAGIGVIAGLRTFSAPAAVSWAAHRRSLPLNDTPFQFLSSAPASLVLSALALAELVGDKLPSTPNRTAAGPLIARALSGALCGAALCAAAKRPIAEGAVCGVLGAMAGAFAGYEIRRRLGRELQAPDAAIAVVEDALAIGGGLSIAASRS